MCQKTERVIMHRKFKRAIKAHYAVMMNLDYPDVQQVDFLITYFNQTFLIHEVKDFFLAFMSLWTKSTGQHEPQGPAI